MSIDAAQLRESSELILQYVTSPEILAEIEAILNTPAGDRLSEACKRLTPEALRKIGINIPPEFRISSRYFEDGKTIEFADKVAGTNIINALNATHPGLVDDLKMRVPDILGKITEKGSGNDVNPLHSCTCVGLAQICVGVGG